MIIVIPIILVTFLTVIVSIWYFLYHKYDQHLKQYPGPLPVPLFGHSLYFRDINKFLEVGMQMHKKYGPAIKLQNGFQPPNIQITDPKLLEHLLGTTKILNKGYNYRFFQRWLGTGLLTSEPIKWKHHRKILTPTFHFQILEQFVNTFNDYSDILVDKFNSIENKDSIDVFPLITLCTLDVICATSMGTAINAQKDGTSLYVRCVKDIARILMERTVNFIGASDFLYSLTPGFQEQERTVKVLHDYTNSVIASRQKELQETQKTWDKSDSDMGIKERNTFLDTLLKYKLQGGQITDEEIREEVDTFMFEGHDTTSSSLSFTLYSLANYPEIQQKVVKELHSIYGDDKDRETTHRDLHEMKYLEMVIKESLRLYPPVPMYERRLEEDTEFNGAVLPKGITLSVFAYAMHRDPQIYPDPERFDPERFSQENQSKRSPYAFVPFSAGPRNCIGQKFAMLEMKTIVSKVLRTFELLPAIPSHKLAVQTTLILNSGTGTNIRFKERKW